MKNLNRVTMIGRLTVDPSLKRLSSGQSVVSLRLATNYYWKDASGEWKSGVDFHTVTAWQLLAERIAEQQKKGDAVFVEGKLRSRSWEAPDGTKRSATEVVAQSVSPMLSNAAHAAGESADTADATDESDWQEVHHLVEKAEANKEAVVVEPF